MKQTLKQNKQKIIGKTISLARSVHEISQKDLALKLNISIRSLQNYESGLSCPDCIVYQAIVDLLPSYNKLYDVVNEYHRKIPIV